MKKVLFNGCSFVAGDEIAWDQYCKETENTLTWKWFCDGNKKTHEQEKIWTNYLHDYKRKHNLPQFVINLLGLTVDDKIDLSTEGKSNDMIAMSTVQYLLSIPPKDRKNYHVVIGWTLVTRIMKYASKYFNFMNLNINHLQHPTVGSEDYEDYIKAVLVNADIEDLAINYFKNVLLLENFLIANNITYTFFRSLGSRTDCIMQPHSFDPNWQCGPLQLDKISNSDNWIRFIPDDPIPVTGSSWTDAILGDHSNTKNYVSKNNGHPSMYAAKIFAEIISNKIIEQQVLN